MVNNRDQLYSFSVPYMVNLYYNLLAIRSEIHAFSRITALCNIFFCTSKWKQQSGWLLVWGCWINGRPENSLNALWTEEHDILDWLDYWRTPQHSGESRASNIKFAYDVKKGMGALNAINIMERYRVVWRDSNRQHSWRVYTRSDGLVFFTNQQD